MPDPFTRATPLAFFEERYEVSRTWSPFNDHVNVLVNRAGGAISHVGGHLYHRPAGAPISELTGGPIDATELRSSLVGEIGCSEQIVDDLFTVWTPPPPNR